MVDGQPRYPENTMVAFKNASRAGYVLELDVKLTSDRVPVVIHDATLDRTTRCTGEVASKTLAQLQACRTDVIGSGSVTRAVTPSERIPTLAEVLSFARREGAFVNMEIKNQPTDPDFDATSGFANTVMAAVSATGFPRSRLIVQSFWPPNLTAAKARLPGVQTSFLTLEQANGGGPAFAQANGHQWVSPAWPVSSAFVADAHGRGLKVVPYTLNAPAEFRAAQRRRRGRPDHRRPDARGAHARPLARRAGARGARPRGAHPARRATPATPARARAFASAWRPSTAAAAWRGCGSSTAATPTWPRAGGRCWRETRAPSIIFRGRPGQTYQFRLRARDRLSNFSPYVYARTAVPLDDRSRRLRFSAGWSRARGTARVRRTLRRARRVRCLHDVALPGNPCRARGAAER